MTNHGYLIHYASEYYDPVKAHEYYMKHRELKGGKSTSGLNEEGKQIAKMVKINIDEKRKGENASADQKKKGIVEGFKSEKEASTKAESEIKTKTTEARNKIKEKEMESAKKDRESKVKSHTDKMNAEINKLKKQLENMTPFQKRTQSEKIQASIDKLKQENAKKKEELTEAYENKRSGINDSYTKDKKVIDEEYQTKKKAIDSDYTSKTNAASEDTKKEKEEIKTNNDNIYMDELEKIKSNPAYQKKAKGTSGGHQFRDAYV